MRCDLSSSRWIEDAWNLHGSVGRICRSETLCWFENGCFLSPAMFGAKFSRTRRRRGGKKEICKTIEKERWKIPKSPSHSSELRLLPSSYFVQNTPTEVPPLHTRAAGVGNATPDSACTGRHGCSPGKVRKPESALVRLGLQASFERRGEEGRGRR